METKVIPLQHKAHFYVETNKEINGIFVNIYCEAGLKKKKKNRQGLAHFCEHAIFSFPTKRFAKRLEKMEYCRTNFYSNAHTSLFAMGFNFETTRENFEEHFEYICHNFDEVIATKEEVEKIILNDKKELEQNEQMLREKYKIDFDKRDKEKTKKEINYEEKSKPQALVEIKPKAWYEKLIEKILKFFKRK